MVEKNESKHDSYAYLDEMSTEALKELLKAKAASDIVDDSLCYLLEVIERREKENSPQELADVDRAWADFQEYYNIPEGKDCSLYGDDDALTIVEEPSFNAKHHHPFRRIALVAAAVACIMALTIPTAFGVNLFRIMGQWTQEMFTFVDTQKPIDQSDENSIPGVTPGDGTEYSTLQQLLDASGIVTALAPTWVPDGFICKNISSTTFANSVDFYAFYEKDDAAITMAITQHEAVADIKETLRAYEKDDNDVILYEANGILHYIFQNNEQTVAVWCDDVYECVISADITVDEMKRMVDSIY